MTPPVLAFLLAVLPACADDAADMAAQVRETLQKKQAAPASTDEPGGRAVGEGHWRLNRSPEERTAAAVSGEGDTVAMLAEKAGFNRQEWRSWLSPPEGGRVALADGRRIAFDALAADSPLAAEQSFRVPNVIVTLWLGEFGSLGEALVDWREDRSYLRRRGFKVESWAPEDESDHVCREGSCSGKEFAADFASSFGRASTERALHGLFVTSHGCRTAVTNEDSSIVVRYSDLRPAYAIAFLIVNACEGDAARSLASRNARTYGIPGLMIPPFETGRPREILKPGEQGTRGFQVGDRRRRTS